MPRGRSLSDMIGANRSTSTAPTITSSLQAAPATLSTYQSGEGGAALKGVATDATKEGFNAFLNAEEGQGLSDAGNAFADSVKDSASTVIDAAKKTGKKLKETFNISSGGGN